VEASSDELLIQDPGDVSLRFGVRLQLRPTNRDSVFEFLEGELRCQPDAEYS